MSRKFSPLKERLLQATTIDGNGCWICSIGVGVGISNRYGQVMIGGGTRISMPNHRAAWVVYRGPIPKGMCVLHTCDTPSCINPSHLFLGSQADNVRDMIAKGRSPDRKGEKGSAAYLTAEQVLEIRFLWDAGLHTQRQISERCGVNVSNVKSIIYRHSWKHI